MSKIKQINCTKSEFITNLTNPARLQERFIKQHYPVHYERIMSSPGEAFSEKLYNYAHNQTTIPVCKMCGKSVAFETYNKGYRTYCCSECLMSDPDRVKKMKRTLIERYGVDNANKSKTIKAKAKATCLKKYGCENPSGSELIKEKKRQRSIARYGVENVSQAVEVIEKIKQSNIKKYGETNFQQAKAKQNNPDIIRFEGRTWVCRCPHSECNKCTEKWYKTKSVLYRDRKKDGTELCTRLLPIQSLISTYELRIRSWLDALGVNYRANVRDVIDGELDIYIPDKKIAIEFNGTYHHRTVDKVKNTGKLKDYHLNKFLKCIYAGIQMISIWQDEILYKEVACKNFIKQTILQMDSIHGYKPISGTDAQEFIINNFPCKYKRQQYMGIFNDNGLVCGVIGMCKINDNYEFEVYCTSYTALTKLFNIVHNICDNPIIITNNDHISYLAMKSAGFKKKNIRLDEKIRTVNNHGSYTTYNSGTTIWTI